MTFAIAAAGTGGHVYPGLAVAEALVDAGVRRDSVVFLGGDRMEASAIPAAGFEFVQLELRGLSRRLAVSNLTLPIVLWRAMRAASSLLEQRSVGAVLGMGGYVTVPVGYAARRMDIRLVLHEQNAHAGLANRLAARWADRVFLSFPQTTRLTGDVVGNPLRSQFTAFDATSLRTEAFDHYHLDPLVQTIGVVGGSLGAGALNGAIELLATDWTGARLQIVHLAGSIHEDTTRSTLDASTVTRRIVGFEDRMDLFYAACDVIVTRAGGSLFEVAATGTPAIVVPGAFGGGHQSDNAVAMAAAGAAIVLPESELPTLATVITDLLASDARRTRMAEAARAAASPDSAQVVATAMMELANA